MTPKGEGLAKIREMVPWQNVAENTAAGFDYLKVLPDVRADRRRRENKNNILEKNRAAAILTR